MKISPVMGYTQRKTLPLKNNIQNNLSFRATYDDFMNTPVNTIRVADERKLNLLNGSEKHMEHLGEVLRTTSDELIYSGFATQSSFFGGISEHKTKKAQARLMPYVQAARKRYEDLEAEIALIQAQDTQNEYMQYRASVCKAEKERMDNVASRAMEYTKEVEINLTGETYEESYEDKLYGAR